MLGGSATREISPEDTGPFTPWKINLHKVSPRIIQCPDEYSEILKPLVSLAKTILEQAGAIPYDLK